MTKKCKSCGETKPRDHFHLAKTNADGYRNKCKSCEAEEHRKWRQSNPERYREIYQRANHKSNLHSRFGITVDEYDQLVALSDGRCAICGESESRDRRLSLDHDHRTGRIRGFLCSRCNLVLGQVDDDKSLLLSAVEYLKFSHDEPIMSARKRASSSEIVDDYDWAMAQRKCEACGDEVTERAKNGDALTLCNPCAHAKHETELLDAKQQCPRCGRYDLALRDFAEHATDCMKENPPQLDGLGYVDVVLEKGPGPDSEFVEVEDDRGNSVSFGEWINPTGDERYWRLRFPIQRGAIPVPVLTSVQDRTEAIHLAQLCAKQQPESYYREPFMPHDWVVNAILLAAGRTKLRERVPQLGSDPMHVPASQLDALGPVTLIGVSRTKLSEQLALHNGAYERAKYYLAGGDSEPIKHDTAPLLGRALVSLYDFVDGIRRAR